MNILITGASGFVGRHISSMLSVNHNVYGLYRDTYPTFSDKINWIYYNFNNRPRTERLPDNIDIIIHAAQSRYYKNPGHENYITDMYNVNIKSTLELLEYAKQINVKKFIYFSSGSVYNQYDDSIHHEYERICNLDNYYKVSKYTSETLVRQYSNLFDTIILRPFFIVIHFYNIVYTDISIRSSLTNN